MAFAERQRLDELAGAPVVIRPIPLELAHLLRVGPHLRVAHRVAREAVGLAVHQISLVPVLRGQEFQVEARFPREHLRHRLVQVHGDLHGLALGLHDHAGIEVVPVEAHAHLNEIPLLRRHVQAHGAALDGPHPVVDDLDAGILLVIESAAERVAEHEDIHALALEVAEVVQLQVRSFALACRQQEHDGKKGKTLHSLGINETKIRINYRTINPLDPLQRRKGRR